MNIWQQHRKPTFIPECKDQSHLATMLNKLKIEADAGRVDNEWTENFIFEMYFRIKQKLPVSPKQQAKIEELFERF